MAISPTLLWISDHQVPPNVRDAIGDEWQIACYEKHEPLGPQLANVALALVYENGQSNDAKLIGRLASSLGRTSTVGIFMLGDSDRSAWEAVARRQGQFFCVKLDAKVEELSAKFAAAAALKPMIRNLRSELAATGEWGQAFAETGDIGEEMRLASRLQRDFLPRILPEVGSVRFAVYFRPASWVSGDIYDVSRLDETHLGFYVVDAVGHGMPAALLTMFVKKALQTKRIVGSEYQIVQPHNSMSELNADICQQDLSSCQFCTAVYGVVDTDSLELTYARGGHPEPILIHQDGKIETLQASGGLLGVFPEEQYESRTAQLASGDRLILYTDGAEKALWGEGKFDSPEAQAEFKQWVDMPRGQIVEQLTRRVETAPAKWRSDDITVLIVDIGR